MKYMGILHVKMYNIENMCRQYFLYYRIIRKKGEFNMVKFLARVAEKYAKMTNTACFIIMVFHQPKMPASMIKKD